MTSSLQSDLNHQESPGEKTSQVLRHALELGCHCWLVQQCLRFTRAWLTALSDTCSPRIPFRCCTPCQGGAQPFLDRCRPSRSHAPQRCISCITCITAFCRKSIGSIGIISDSAPRKTITR